MRPALQSRTLAGTAAFAVSLAVVLVVGGCGGSTRPATATDSTSTTTTTATVPQPTTQTQPVSTATTSPGPSHTTVVLTVVGGKPRDGIRRPEIENGARVRIVVRSDTADEVHLHGYNLSQEVGPGKPARIDFTANVPGRFEVELEQTGVQLAELTVR